MERESLIRVSLRKILRFFSAQALRQKLEPVCAILTHAVLVEPGFFRVVVDVDIDDLRVPVVLLARHIVPTLKNENSLARRRQMVSQRASSGASFQ